MFKRYEVEAESRFFNVPSIDGSAHISITGEGPPVVMINGIGTPGAMWAPLMAEIDGFCLFAVDLPGYGLTDTTEGFADNLQEKAKRFIIEVLDRLGLESPPFIANSLGSLFTSWLCLDQPTRVAALIHVGCPAIVLGTSAPLPMRLLSVKLLGRLLTWLQPPSHKQVEQLSKMVKEYPLVPELAELLVATERLPGFRQTFLSTLNTLLRLRGNRPKMRLRDEQLAQIDKPTLIFWGKDDPFGSPEVGKQMVKTMPKAELTITEG
ncbi:MAG: alpha/beta fold hydrolase, partial [Candidatus Halalkalibacterium sp. M3_1C_030]